MQPERPTLATALYITDPSTQATGMHLNNQGINRIWQGENTDI